MSFRIDPRRDTGAEVRRVLDEQIGRALDALAVPDGDRHRAVYSARRRFKKLRGVLRLIRPAAPGFAAAENVRWRDAGRSLASARDAGAAVTALDALLEGFGDLLSPHAFVAVRQALVAERDAMAGTNADLDLDLAAARDACEEGRAALNRLTLPDDPASAFAEGTAGTYAKATKTLAAARRSNDPAPLHEMRKHLKLHWLHVRLLQDIWPEAMRSRRAEAKALADDLGALQDLDVLRRAVEALPGSAAAERHRDLLLTLVARRQAVLAGSTVHAAGRLLAERPKDFRRRLEALWREAAVPAPD